MSVYLGAVSMADGVAAGVGALVAILDFARRRRDKTHPLRPRKAPTWLKTPSDARNFVRYGNGPWPRRRRMVGGLIIVPNRDDSIPPISITIDGTSAETQRARDGRAIRAKTRGTVGTGKHTLRLTCRARESLVSFIEIS